jgi:Fic family protein
MDLDALGKSPIGQLVPITGTDAKTGGYAYFAFLPDPLPEDPALSHEAWTAVSKAEGALGRLRQACAHLPNPGLLIAPALAQEAVSTSALEGTYAALPEVLEARLTSIRSKSPEVAEIRAYETIAYTAFEWVRDRQITLGLLSDLQGELAADSRNPVRDPGKIREHQVLIGPEGCTVYEARFVPAPPDDRLRSGLDAWQSWVQSEHALPAPLATAMAHYQFETLHPFGDGNGRIGRLVIVLQLLRAEVLSEPALVLSPWLLRRRAQYQDHLLHLSETGDWNPWVTFFCHALCQQAEGLVKVAEELVRWLDAVRVSLNQRHWGGTIYRLAEDLIDWPVITMMFAAEKYGVSVPTAKSAIDRLVEIGVLTEMTGRSYRRVFGAQDVIALVESL